MKKIISLCAHTVNTTTPSMHGYCTSLDTDILLWYLRSWELL